MKYQLTAKVTHSSFKEPIEHMFYYQGETIDDILDQIDTQTHHINNLRHYGKTSFKDTAGVKHEWVLEPVENTINAGY